MRALEARRTYMGCTMCTGRTPINNVTTQEGTNRSGSAGETVHRTSSAISLSLFSPFLWFRSWGFCTIIGEKWNKGHLGPLTQQTTCTSAKSLHKLKCCLSCLVGSSGWILKQCTDHGSNNHHQWIISGHRGTLYLSLTRKQTFFSAAMTSP